MLPHVQGRFAVLIFLQTMLILGVVALLEQVAVKPEIRNSNDESNSKSE